LNGKSGTQRPKGLREALTPRMKRQEKQVFMNSSTSSDGYGRNISRPHGLKARCGSAAKRLGMAALFAVFLLGGCVSASTVARMEGFDAQWRGFDALPPNFANPDELEKYGY
jgi:hypothetical protein